MVDEVIGLNVTADEDVIVALKFSREPFGVTFFAPDGLRSLTVYPLSPYSRRRTVSFITWIQPWLHLEITLHNRLA